MNILNKISKIYYRKHPETALRYLPIVDLIKKLKLMDKKILEVGSGSYGIAPYINRKVIGLDTSFDEPKYSNLIPVKGSALDIPFLDDSFDCVILSDVLEHMPQASRKKAIDQCLRVSSKYLIISGPFDGLAFNQDKWLANYSQKKLGKTHKFFLEHLEHGLPELSITLKEINKLNEVKSVKVITGTLNLTVRKHIMKLYLSQSKLGYYLYLKGLMPFVTILKYFNHEPTYRKIILVEKT